MDDIEHDFLAAQGRAITALAEESDILSLRILDERVFLLHYQCTGLVEARPGEIAEHEGFDVGVYLHENYLRRVVPHLLLTLAHPANCFHPNIKGPLMCIGEVVPGTPLVEIAVRCFELLAFQSVGAAEHNALNREACKFVRANFERFPVDSRALKWRRAQEARA